VNNIIADKKQMEAMLTIAFVTISVLKDGLTDNENFAKSRIGKAHTLAQVLVKKIESIEK